MAKKIAKKAKAKAAAKPAKVKAKAPKASAKPAKKVAEGRLQEELLAAAPKISKKPWGKDGKAASTASKILDFTHVQSGPTCTQLLKRGSAPT